MTFRNFLGILVLVFGMQGCAGDGDATSDSNDSSKGQRTTGEINEKDASDSSTPVNMEGDWEMSIVIAEEDSDSMETIEGLMSLRQGGRRLEGEFSRSNSRQAASNVSGLVMSRGVIILQIIEANPISLRGQLSRTADGPIFSGEATYRSGLRKADRRGRFEATLVVVEEVPRACLPGCVEASDCCQGPGCDNPFNRFACDEGICRIQGCVEDSECSLLLGDGYRCFQVEEPHAHQRRRGYCSLPCTSPEAPSSECASAATGDSCVGNDADSGELFCDWQVDGNHSDAGCQNNDECINGALCVDPVQL